jgi:hypothetical protein
MPTNLSQFNRALKRATKDYPAAQLVPFHKKLAFDTLASLVRRTRVDTGRAKGGWQTTVNYSPENDINRLDVSGELAMAEANAALANLGPFQNVLLTNNVHYIRYLNDGTDKFAGDHMVEGALAEVGASFGA